MEKKEDRSEEHKLPEVDQELSQVATNPKQNILILIVVIGVFAYVFYNFFLKDNKKVEKQVATPVPTIVGRPATDSSTNNIPEIPTLPPTPKLEDPVVLSNNNHDISKVPELKPELPQIESKVLSPAPKTGSPVLPVEKIKTDSTNERLQRKRKSAIFLVSGTTPTKTTTQIQQETDFAHRGDLGLVLNRGKIMDAVVETAINTDIGGEIRAIISRDVYSEQGRNILIPKGSRIFGSYATDVSGAYGRIEIIWTTIDLLNGYRFTLSGTGIDHLGRKGNQGRVDDKFKERLTNSVLSSALNIALAKGLDKLVPPQTSSNALATNTQQAQSIQNLTNAILSKTATDTTKINQICAQVPSLITDKTSSAYQQIAAVCPNPSGATPADQLKTLTATITSVVTSLLSTNFTNAEETQSQKSSKQAYKDISDTLKNYVENQQFKTTITIDQGTSLKIYVNKDYVFPKAAIGASRR